MADPLNGLQINSNAGLNTHIGLDKSEHFYAIGVMIYN